MSPMGNVVTFRAVMARFFGGAFPLFFQELEGVKSDCEAPWHSRACGGMRPLKA